jgi:hypothetical protein
VAGILDRPLADRGGDHGGGASSLDRRHRLEDRAIRRFRPFARRPPGTPQSRRQRTDGYDLVPQSDAQPPGGPDEDGGIAEEDGPYLTPDGTAGAGAERDLRTDAGRVAHADRDHRPIVAAARADVRA